LVQPVYNVVDYSCSSGRSHGTPSLMPHIANNNNQIGSGSNQNKGKRLRSKFSDEQKEKMFDLARRIGWKIQKTNDEMVMAFCNRIGVCKSTFKIWMQNNKKKHVTKNNNMSLSLSVLVFSGYGVLDLVPLWSLVKCKYIYDVSSLMDMAYRMSE
nr:homeodomain-like protein [Tanacetum cinerariifolium]